MAGGDKRGNHGSMEERLARTREREQERAPLHSTPNLRRPPGVEPNYSAAPEPDPVLPAPGVGPGRHVWVHTHTARLPGLLTDWRKDPDGWHGYVVHTDETSDGRHLVIRQWVPAAAIEPAS